MQLPIGHLLSRRTERGDIEGLLHGRIPMMDKILATTQQPGMSVGVIHEGKEVFKHNFGVLDVVTGQKPDSDTLYCIASLCKAFMAASLDILVQEQEEKVSWDRTIESIIPKFKHFEKSDIFSAMTVRDICSHRTGLVSLDEIIQGLDGRILVPKTNVVDVCNALPVKHDLRTNFLYNNAMYELAGLIVEDVSGYPTWGHFQHDRIFRPLGMTRSTAFRSVHKTDNNIAKPYMILTSGVPLEVPPTELSAKSMNGGSGGIRSSVNDLLKWCKCLLQSFDEDPRSENLVRKGSPMFNRSTITNLQSAEVGDYCAGWCYHRTPGKLGMISPNRKLISPVLGSDSSSLLLYGHQGDVPGYTCSLYIIPETKSALVILTNGTGLSDASDWIAQDLIQTIYGLEPRVDFLGVANQAKEIYISYTEDLPDIYRNHITPALPLDQFSGSYIMKNLDIVCLDIAVEPEDPTKLQMMVNKQPDQVWKLWYCNDDKFCRLPDSIDQCLSRGLDKTILTSCFISFMRGSDGKVNLLCWELDGVEVHFLLADRKKGG
ncbi:beta-lactamase/transpeptidase-like protein [Hypoxylon crocopeplum]|nr:beta-lactamase/transpeptidase-like protein [Hypoxylon crocopeplum]